MIQKYIAILILCLIIAECKVKQPTKELGFSCEIVNNIKEKDQYYRRYLASPQSPYVHLLDSLIKLNGYEEGSKIMSSIDTKLLKSLIKQVDSLLNTTHKYEKIVWDSLWKLQNDLDYKNVMDLISMISNVGYSNIDTIPEKCGLESFIVFVHTPAELCDTVYSVIEKINLKSFNPNRYRHIMWHLSGRNGMN
ncbi:MAG: hypothetical protein IPL98_14055 [Saprospiraceae bacterium]|nr:hypothetical protein [Saprospiraceae bacterium]